MITETTLSSAWDQHLASEFAAQSPEQALATMTAEPYVNVVPLMIGSRGRDETRDFYANHFLCQIPPDMETVPVSRTVGQGRVVDELIMRFTHSIRMDWLLPGIAPTGKRVQVPMVAVVQFEGDNVTCVRYQAITAARSAGVILCATASVRRCAASAEVSRSFSAGSN